MEEAEYARRAKAAWYRTDGGQEITDWEVAQHEDRDYVLLFSSEKSEEIPIAVYRVTNQGQLKRLKRWPASLVLDETT